MERLNPTVKNFVKPQVFSPVSEKQRQPSPGSAPLSCEDAHEFYCTCETQTAFLGIRSLFIARLVSLGYEAFCPLCVSPLPILAVLGLCPRALHISEPSCGIVFDR